MEPNSIEYLNEPLYHFTWTTKYSKQQHFLYAPISLFKFIDRNYQTSDELYFVGGNPFVKSDMKFVFFMNNFPKIRSLNNTSIENIRKDLFSKNIKSFNLLVTRGKITRGKKFTEFSNLNDFCQLASYFLI